TMKLSSCLVQTLPSLLIDWTREDIFSMNQQKMTFGHLREPMQFIQLIWEYEKAKAKDQIKSLKGSLSLLKECEDNKEEQNLSKIQLQKDKENEKEFDNLNVNESIDEEKEYEKKIESELTDSIEDEKININQEQSDEDQPIKLPYFTTYQIPSSPQSNEQLKKQLRQRIQNEIIRKLDIANIRIETELQTTEDIQTLLSELRSARGDILKMIQLSPTRSEMQNMYNILIKSSGVVKQSNVVNTTQVMKDLEKLLKADNITQQQINEVVRNYYYERVERDAFIREYVREVTLPHATVTTIPTALGSKQIDAFHPLYAPVNCLQDKPIADIAPQNREAFMILGKAHEDKLLSVTVSASREAKLNAMNKLIKKLSQDNYLDNNEEEAQIFIMTMRTSFFSIGRIG
ncbi:MAG: hypothetical protein EZS28_013349, partial [Streblomastix strix]